MLVVPHHVSEVQAGFDCHVPGGTPNHQRLDEVDVLGAAIAWVVLHSDTQRQLLLAAWNVSAGELGQRYRVGGVDYPGSGGTYSMKKPFPRFLSFSPGSAAACPMKASAKTRMGGSNIFVTMDGERKHKERDTVANVVGTD